MIDLIRKPPFAATRRWHGIRPRPAGVWANRFGRIKRAGFICVETSVFWNYREAQSKQSNHTGNRDLDAFKARQFDESLRGPYEHEQTPKTHYGAAGFLAIATFAFS